jgi:hypothetical protein
LWDLAQSVNATPSAARRFAPHLRPEEVNRPAAKAAKKRPRDLRLGILINFNVPELRARSALAPGARKTAQPTARNQNDRKVLDGQITISD